jgi:hypothetical protein
VAVAASTRLAAFVVLTVALGGCASQSRYVPGLGEIMSLTQMRHIKLWFAGEAGNWPLAAYELDELQEGFDDAARLNPTHDGVPIAVLVRDLTTEPLQQLSTAISAEDPVAFAAAFDSLSAVCNECHRAARHAFNVVQRPTSNPYSDQVFDVRLDPTPAR